MNNKYWIEIKNKKNKKTDDQLWIESTSARQTNTISSSFCCRCLIMFGIFEYPIDNHETEQFNYLVAPPNRYWFIVILFVLKTAGCRQQVFCYSTLHRVRDTCINQPMTPRFWKCANWPCLSMWVLVCRRTEQATTISIHDSQELLSNRYVI